MIQTDELALQRIGAVLLEAVEPPSDGAFQYECGNLAEATIYFVLFTLLDTYTDNVQFELKMERLDLLNDWKRSEQEKVNPGKIKAFVPVLVN